MEGTELNGRKRKVPNVLPSDNVKKSHKPKKMKLQQLLSDGVMCSVPEKKEPESSLGSEQDWMSPPKGDTVVVLALTADPSEKKNVQRSNSSTKTSKKKNVGSKSKLEITETHKEACVDHSEEKKAQRGSSSTKAKKAKNVGLKVKLEIAEKHEEACVDLQDCFPLSHLLHEPKRKKRSDRGKRSGGEKADLLAGNTKVDGYTQEVLPNMSSEAVPSEVKKKRRSSQVNELTLKNGINKLSNTLIDSSLDDKSNEKIHTSSISAEVSHKVENDSALQNQETPRNKKRRSCQGKKLAFESGETKLPNALENNNSDQGLVEEKPNLLDEKNSTSLIVTKVRRKVDSDSCKLQNQETPVNRSSEVASRTADKHEEVHMIQSDIKKKRRSGQCKKLAPESRTPKPLVNNSSDHKSNEVKLNLPEGKFSSPIIAAKVSCHKADADTCELQKESPVNKSSEAASIATDEQGEVHTVQSDIKKKRRSGQNKKVVLASAANKLPNSLVMNNSDLCLIEEKSSLLGGKISAAQVATEVSHMVDCNTCDLQNQDAPANKSSPTATRTADKHEEVSMVQSNIKKKRRSGQGKKLALESRAPKALVNNSSDQNLNEEKSNLSNGKVSTSLIAAKISHNADADTCELLKQEAPVNKSSGAASRTADEHGEVHMVQLEVKGKKCSAPGKKHMLESGASKLPDTLVNGHSGQSLIKEKSKLLDGKISSAQLPAEVSHKVDCDSYVLQNQDAPVNKSLEFASRTKDNHEEVNSVGSEVKKKMRFVRGKKPTLVSEGNLLSNTSISNHLDQHLMAEKSDIFEEKTTTTSPIASLKADHKVDDFNLCEVQNREVGVSKVSIGLDAASQISNTQEEACQTQRKGKRKEKTHRKEKMKPTSHQATAFDNLSTLEVSAEHPDLSFGQGDITSYSDKCSLTDMASSIGDVINDDKVTGTVIYDDNCLKKSVPPEGANDSRSPTRTKEKKHKKGKMKSTSDQAKASDDPSSLDLSAEPADLCSGEEVVGAAVSIGEVRRDDMMIETVILDDNLLKKSASLEIAQFRQFPRKLLILDLNGLLVDIVSSLPKGCIADKRVSQKALLKRPFCDDFLTFCFETFNVAVWSSRTKRNVDTVVDFIMGDKRHMLLFCWDQSHCTKTGFPTVENDDKLIVLKELRKVWNKGKPDLPWERGEYNESNTLLLDDSPYKALLNPRHTAIFPDSYDCRNRKDDALGPGGSLRMYLERLATVENVQKFIEENPFGQRAVTCKNPSWRYYMNMMKANRFRMPM